MNDDLELTVWTEGECWVTEVDGHRLRAVELSELEGCINETVLRLPHLVKHENVRVRLVFDFDSIPQWLRQYHSHYFNSRLTVMMPVARQPVADS